MERALFCGGRTGKGFGSDEFRLFSESLISSD